MMKRQIAETVVRMMGWRIQGEVPPDIRKLVMLGVPHTSNWDFFMMMCCAWRYGLRVKWLGKEALFSNPFKRFFCTLMGGIKVDRTQSDQAVDNIANILMHSKKNVCLAIAPEGSRHKKPGWRSGFFYIAQKARIPIGLGYIDYANRTMGVGPILSNLIDINSTMTEIEKFYREIKGKFPEKQSPIKIIKNEEVTKPKF